MQNMRSTANAGAVLSRGDDLLYEPVVPHFRLPLAALCDAVEAAESPQQTAL